MNNLLLITAIKVINKSMKLLLKMWMLNLIK